VILTKVDTGFVRNALATTILDTIEPSAGFPAMAACAAALYPAAGTIFFPLTRGGCSCTERNDTGSKTETDAEVALIVSAVVSPMPPTMAVFGFGDLVATV
jgi:hypothetical protein